MAFSAPQTGNGVTVTFGTTSAYTSLQWTSVGLDGVSTEAVETTHLGTTGGKTFIPAALYDGGTVSLRCNADTDVPPVTVHATETVTVGNIPITDGTNTTAGDIQFPAFITNYSTVYENDVVVAYDVSLKVCGSITYTDSSA